MSNFKFLKLVLTITLLLVTITMSACEDAKNLPDGLYAVMETTRGEIILSLEFEKTPLTVTLEDRIVIFPKVDTWFTSLCERPTIVIALSIITLP